MPEEFDIESFRKLPSETQAIAKDIFSGLGISSAAAMGEFGPDFAQWRALNDFSTNATRALNGFGIAKSLSEGNNQEAFEGAVDWITAEAAQHGLKEVIEATTRDGFASRYGYRLPSQWAHQDWSKAVAGAVTDLANMGADSIEGAAEALKQRTTDTQYIQVTEQQYQVLTEHSLVKDVFKAGGLYEYSHFEELPNSNYPARDGELDSWKGRPDETQFPQAVESALDRARKRLFTNPIEDSREYQWSIPPIKTIPGVDSVSDFVTLNPSSSWPSVAGSVESVRFDLTTGQRLGIDLSRDIKSYVFNYGVNAQFKDERDITWNELVGDTSHILDNAQYLEVELRRPSGGYDETDLLKPFNHKFYGGSLDASGYAGGVVLIGRDDGHHTGSAHDDLSLDADYADMGAGNDVVVLDNEIGSHAHGGEGNDKIYGGSGNEKLFGGTGEDLIRGGGGDDMLAGAGYNAHLERVPDDGVRDVLRGGAGRDVYFTGDNDVIEATENEDKEDVINFSGITLDGPDATQSNGGQLRGRNGETYVLGADGSTMTVTYDDKELTIRDFQNGDFGIDMMLTTPLSKEASVTTGTPLYTTVEYMKDHVDQMVVNLETKAAAGDITAQEEVLSGILTKPESALAFGTLHKNGVEMLNIEIDSKLPPEENGIAIYGAVGDELKARNLHVNSVEIEHQPQLEYTQEIESNDYSLV